MLTHKDLIDLGFEYSEFKEPLQSCGIDLYYRYDFYFKKIGVKTDLVLRKKGDLIKVEGFYSSKIQTKEQIASIIQLLST